MSRLQDNLNSEIVWRTNEIALIRKLIKYDQLSDSQRELIIKYSSVSLYSLWEGFVVKCMRYYIDEINNLNINVKDISLNILTHTLDSKFNLESGRTHFGSKCAFINDIHNHFENEVINITQKIPTKSNVNYKELNGVFECFGFSSFLDEKYHTDLNLFLKVRNDIAHGEDSITVSEEMISKFSLMIQDLMADVVIIIYNEFENENYIKPV